MKTTLLLLAGLLILGAPAMAGTGAPSLPSYAAKVRISSVPASPAYIEAFQNTSTDQDVIINRIDVANCSTQTVTSGMVQFWVFTSTRVTHSDTTSMKTYSYRVPLLTTAPAAVVGSTAPINVQLDGDSAVLTVAQRNALSGTSLPVVRPLAANLDETATTNTYDTWAHESPDYGDALVLARNTQRTLVIEKRQLGATDWTAGCVDITIHYTLR